MTEPTTQCLTELLSRMNIVGEDADGSPSTNSVIHRLTLLPVVRQDADKKSQLYYTVRYARTPGAGVRHRKLWRWISAIEGPLSKGRIQWEQSFASSGDPLVALEAVRPSLKADGTLVNGTVKWEICEDESSFNQLSHGDKLPRMHGVRTPFAMVSAGPRGRMSESVTKLGFTSKWFAPRSMTRELERCMAKALATALGYPPGSTASKDKCESAVSHLVWERSSDDELSIRTSSPNPPLKEFKAALRPRVLRAANELKVLDSRLSALAFGICGENLFDACITFMEYVED